MIECYLILNFSWIQTEMLQTQHMTKKTLLTDLSHHRWPPVKDVYVNTARSLMPVSFTKCVLFSMGCITAVWASWQLESTPPLIQFLQSPCVSTKFWTCYIFFDKCNLIQQHSQLSYNSSEVVRSLKTITSPAWPKILKIEVMWSREE